MKTLITVLMFAVGLNSGLAQSGWTKEELASANTAANVVYLDDVEKETLLYINLARLYPQKFAKVEVEPYFGPPNYGDYLRKSTYKTSLLNDLRKRKPIHAMRPMEEITKETDCFAKELGESGRVGHERKICNELAVGAECCSFGMAKGKDIALQLLIDHDVPSLGHRLACLGDFRYSGLSFCTHTVYRYCLVMQMR